MNADVAATMEEATQAPLRGLIDEEAAQRLREFGPNDGPPSASKRPQVLTDGHELEFRKHVQYGGASLFLPFRPMLSTQTC
jgi:hypothetical protein